DFPRTPEDLWQAEAGIKMNSNWYALAAVAYWMQIANFPSQDARVDPATGATSFVTVYAGQARTLGLEVEAAAQPLQFLRLNGVSPLQAPAYTKSPQQDTDASGNPILKDYPGNQTRRIPQILADVTATFLYRDASVGVNWTFVGHRFSNNANTVDLP